jgi:hypothetical protein
MSEIVVNDRRHFDKDGNLNTDSAPEAPPEAGKTAAPESGPGAAGSAGSGPAGSIGEGPPPRVEAGDMPATLSTLLIGLATQALMHLGEEAGPEAPAPGPPDLPAAKHFIDLLGIIQKKTDGNLDHAESSLLEALLYDLRMRYVALKKKS